MADHHAALVEQARGARDEAMATARHAADPRISEVIDAHIADANATGEPWSANDIRDQMPAGNRGLVGDRVRAAALRRPVEMVQVGRTPSTLESTHAKDIGVWVGVPQPAPGDAS